MNKKTVLTALVLAAGVGASFAQGFGSMLTPEERAKLQSLPPEERQAYVQELRQKYGITTGRVANSQHDAASLIANVPASELDETERQILINQYGEEKMARDLYLYAFDKYGLDVFANIAKSEQAHMDALKALLDRYGVEPPADYAKDNELYTELKAQIDQGLKEALEVGIKVEIVDIQDIINAIKATDNDDIKVVLVRIGGGSFNHLRGFVQALKQQGFDTDLPRQEYISEEELNSKGPLNYKLAELLEKEGIEIPEQVSSAAIKAQTVQRQQRGFGQNRGVFAKRAALGAGVAAKRGVRVDRAKVLRFKQLIQQRYQHKINSYDVDKLYSILEKIDQVEQKIIDGDYPEDKKQLYLAVLEALREIIQERLAQLDQDYMNQLLDGIFE